ncbi:hypothetical protein FACS1894113_3450 [Alphaproteobacteria bacterium]|nr:hypothetical protein FACS1894113_3450 [Alphaproteobacteria bacterium]
MKFFRVIFGAGLLVCVILVWEALRSDLIPVWLYFNHAEKISRNMFQERRERSYERDPYESRERENRRDYERDSARHSGGSISFERGFADIVKDAKHSVVNVATMQLVENDDNSEGFGAFPFDELFRDFFDFPKKKQKKTKKAHALGSGFIIKIKDNLAYVVTNNHVVEKAKKVIVYLYDQTELQAEIHATDKRTDIAVLTFNLKQLDEMQIRSLRAMEWGASEQLDVGAWVLAIGNPLGIGCSATCGIVSAHCNYLPGSSLNLVQSYIQHSAQINIGNSGGCLLNTDSKVIGINNAIYTNNGGNVGIGFAIPSNIAKPTVEQLIEFKRTFRGWLGATVQAVKAKQAESVGLIDKTLDSSKVYGAFIADIIPGSPAEKSGLKVADIVIKFDGKHVSESSSLTSLVSMAKIGSKVEMIVWRNTNGKWGSVNLTVQVGDFEKAMEDGTLENKDSEKLSSKGKETEVDIDALGITVSDCPPYAKEQYGDDVNVVVIKVDDTKENSFFGPIFEPGDGIISVNNQKITNITQLKKIINDIKNDKELSKRQIPFVLMRNKSVMFVATVIDFSEPKNEENKNEKKEDSDKAEKKVDKIEKKEEKLEKNPEKIEKK